MASFQAKIGWKTPKKRKNKSYWSVPFLHDAQQKIPKKQSKIFKKLKNTFMTSCLAKIGLKKMRKGENKNYRLISFLPNAKLKIPKKQQ